MRRWATAACQALRNSCYGTKGTIDNSRADAAISQWFFDFVCGRTEFHDLLVRPFNYRREAAKQAFANQPVTVRQRRSRRRSLG